MRIKELLQMKKQGATKVEPFVLHMRESLKHIKEQRLSMEAQRRSKKDGKA